MAATAEIESLLDGMTTEKRERFESLVAQQATRKIEALRIYEPLPEQERFHRSRATERVIRGGNRSGKSLATFVEDARAATGTDPHGKYPNGNMVIWIICYEERNIGRTAHRLLFRPGAFKMIRDLGSGQWRSFRPWEASDKDREKEAKPAPPLIPPRMIESISWQDKGRRIFSLVRLKNGSEIYAFSSGGEPPQGDPADLIHIDEDLKYEHFVPELEARLSDRKGRLIWSVFPHSKNDALCKLCDRAEDQKDRDNPDVEEFHLTFSGNAHIDADEKRKRFEGWDEDERRARDLGEFLNDRILVYPNFDIETHGCPQNCDPWGHSLPEQPWEIDRKLKGKLIPPDWTRYMVVDPGHSVCAVLFAAVPPPRYGDHVVCYDELYLRNCDLEKFGRAVADRASGQRFYAFIIDDHGSRIRTALSGKTVRQQYSECFRDRGVESQVTGYGFIPGSDDVQGRISAVRGWLAIRDDGTTRLRVLRGCCPNLEKEFMAYKKRIVGGIIGDEPVAKNNHLMNDLEYLAAYDPRYHAPVMSEAALSPAYREFQLLMKELGRGRDETIHLGPGRRSAPFPSRN